MNWKRSEHIILILLLVQIFTVEHLYGCGGNAPTANFNVDDASPVVGETITFTDLSTNNPTNWNWNFGAGATPATATTQNPSTSYTTQGTKTVILTASNYWGNDSETKNNYINVGSPPTAGTIGSAQTICNGTTPAQLTSITDGGGSGTITYEWQTNASGSYTTISGATSSGYQPPALTATTSYRRRTVAVYGGKTRYSTYTTPVTITVQSVVASGAIGSAQTICSGLTPTALTSISDGSGSGTISYEWQTNAGGSYTTISGALSSVYQPPSLTSSTSYRRRTISVLNGTSCYSTYTTEITVTVNSLPVPSFTVQPDPAECQGDDVIYTTEPLMTDYTWSVPGTNGSDYSITLGGIGTGSNTVMLKWLTTGSKTVTVGYTGGNGCASASPASSVTTVNPTPVIGTFN